MIYFGSTVTVEVEGQTWRAEQCSHCGQRFYYPVNTAATGSATNPYFLDSSSSQRAEEDARNNLGHALRHEVFPVPCPHCTLFQRYMVPAVQADQFPEMRLAGRVLLLGLTPLALFLDCLLVMAKDTIEQDVPSTMATVLMFGLPALCLSAGVGILLARSRKQTRLDPNATEYTAARQRMAAALALKPEEFARLGIPWPSLDLPRQRRGQLVNRNCYRCEQRITNELDSRFCPDCGSPVHNHCAVPTEGGGCPACGVEAPTTQH